MRAYDPRNDDRFGIKYPIFRERTGYGLWVKANLYVLTLIVIAYTIYTVRAGSLTPAFRALFGP